MNTQIWIFSAVLLLRQVTGQRVCELPPPYDTLGCSRGMISPAQDLRKVCSTYEKGACLPIYFDRLGCSKSMAELEREGRLDTCAPLLLTWYNMGMTEKTILPPKGDGTVGYLGYRPQVYLSDRYADYPQYADGNYPRPQGVFRPASTYPRPTNLYQSNDRWPTAVGSNPNQQSPTYQNKYPQVTAEKYTSGSNGESNLFEQPQGYSSPDTKAPQPQYNIASRYDEITSHIEDLQFKLSNIFNNLNTRAQKEASTTQGDASRISDAIDQGKNKIYHILNEVKKYPDLLDTNIKEAENEAYATISKVEALLIEAGIPENERNSIISEAKDQIYSLFKDSNYPIKRRI